MIVRIQCNGAFDFAIDDRAFDAISNRVPEVRGYFGNPIADCQLNEVPVEVSRQTRVEKVVEISLLDTAGAPEVHVEQFLPRKPNS